MESIQSFIHQLARMQWSDYVDIILVAFLIYKVLPLIRTPSTMRIARAVVAVVPIALYNGQKATKSKALQWGFYLFYPVHLLLLRDCPGRL